MFSFVTHCFHDFVYINYIPMIVVLL